MTPFKGLPVGELDRLASIAQIIKHGKGETVFSEGDEATSVWILQQGRLEIFKYTSDGKPRAIEVINPKELYGTLCRIGGPASGFPLPNGSSRPTATRSAWKAHRTKAAFSP